MSSTQKKTTVKKKRGRPKKTDQTVSEKRAYLKALKEREKLRVGLPHLYGWPWYPWAKEFFQSTNNLNFLVAANQCSKSSTMIRKVIHWATEKDIWPKLWPTVPKQFWYFYPTFDVSTAEWREKWVKEFMPAGDYKDDPKYGWKAFFQTNKKISHVEFNSGVTLYFKSYDQQMSALQTSSVYAVFADEEMPEHLYHELNARIMAPTIRGYMHQVFTATLGLEIWRRVMEEVGEHELFPQAAKWHVTLYDCLKYEDGSVTPWTEDYIEERKALCKNQAEIDRRIMGRFVLDTDRKYSAFNRGSNLATGHKLPRNWLTYAGVDCGSGGKAHPAAIVFVSVNPQFTKGRVFLGWRGDEEDTASADILDMFQTLKGKQKLVAQYYDHQSRDFYIIASRRGEPFSPANKSQEFGVGLLNSLFKNDMLKVYESVELMKLVIELESVRSSTPKSNAKDDFIDALRFAVALIPWDFSVVDSSGKTSQSKKKKMDPREAYYLGLDRPKNDGLDLLAAEFDEANLLQDDWLEEVF